MTRILIADDHEMVRLGLKKVLEARPDWAVCGEANNGREAVALAAELKPDIVVMDFSMPELNGLGATRQIRARLPHTEVLILTMHDSEELARETLAAGARGFVLKTDVSKTLVAAVENLSNHRPFFTAKVTEMMLGELLKERGPKAAAGKRLTGREREIVQLIAEGRRTKEVASALGITVKTAETHRANIMRKLELHSANELVRYAIRNRIVQP